MAFSSQYWVGTRTSVSHVEFNGFTIVYQVKHYKHLGNVTSQKFATRQTHSVTSTLIVINSFVSSITSTF